MIADVVAVIAAFWDDVMAHLGPADREAAAGYAREILRSDDEAPRFAAAQHLVDLAAPALPAGHPVRRALATEAGKFVTAAQNWEAAKGLLAQVTDADLPPGAMGGPGGGGPAPWEQPAPGMAKTEPATATLPVTIYLSDERIHEQVEEAIAELLASAGLQILSRDDPVAGSWFRRMVAVEAAATLAHGADARLSLTQDAQRTAILMQGLPALLGALQPTKDAVIRVGTLLILKVDWTVNVIQLTAAQQLKLDHSPQLASSPQEIAKVLNIIRPEDPGDGHAYELSPPAESG